MCPIPPIFPDDGTEHAWLKLGGRATIMRVPSNVQMDVEASSHSTVHIKNHPLEHVSKLTWPAWRDLHQETLVYIQLQGKHIASGCFGEAIYYLKSGVSGTLFKRKTGQPCSALFTEEAWAQGGAKTNMLHKMNNIKLLWPSCKEKPGWPPKFKLTATKQIEHNKIIDLPSKWSASKVFHAASHHAAA